MSLTGADLLQGLSEFLNDWRSYVTTSAGNSGGTTAVSTSLIRFGDNRFQGQHLRLHSTGFPVRTVQSSVQSTGTLTVQQPFAAQVANTTTFSLHRYEPLKKYLALDQARLEVMDHVFRNIVDDTLTGDGRSDTFDIPSTVEQGPHIAWVERPLAPVQDWNFLAEPEGNASTGYTTSNMTLSTRSKSNADLIVPKIEDTCVSFAVAASTNGTATLAVADMENGVTAALAAGRKVTFARDVFCLTASRVSLKIVEDGATTTTGTAHQGKGWERIFVEKTIGPTNATTFSVVLDVTNSAAAVAGFWERGWLYYGGKERVIDSTFDLQKTVTLRTDDTNQHVIFPKDSLPPRGYQIRLQGKAPLTALGTDLTAQTTNSMEVDAKSATILYARAAELLLEWGAIVSDDVAAVQQRIVQVQKRAERNQRQWADTAEAPGFHSPWA